MSEPALSQETEESPWGKMRAWLSWVGRGRVGGGGEDDDDDDDDDDNNGSLCDEEVCHTR
jgi:hypothetical protein